MIYYDYWLQCLVVSEIHNLWNISPPDVWCLQCVWCVPNQSNSIRTHCLGRPRGHVTRPGNRSWRTMVLRRSCDDTRPWGHLNSWHSTFQLVSVSCLLATHLLHLYFSFRVWSRSPPILWDRAVELQTKVHPKVRNHGEGLYSAGLLSAFTFKTLLRHYA